LGEEGQPDYRMSLEKNYKSLSGSLGSTYHLTQKFLIRSNFAAAYRTPNLSELTANGQHETRYEIGDQNLSPEKSFEIDLSMHYHIDNLTLDLAGFYNSIRDYIYISPTGDTTETGIYIYQYMQSNSFLYGAEAGIHYHPQTMKWLHLLTTFSAVTGRKKSGDFLPFIPAKKIDFEFRAEKERLAFLHNTFVMATVTSAFNQYNAAPEETPTKGYFLFDASLGGQIQVKEQQIILGLGANNIFDTKYVDHLSTLKEVGYYNPGRNITLTIKVPFLVRKPE
jgi:iron complex outermembrane recepter protein